MSWFVVQSWDFVLNLSESRFHKEYLSVMIRFLHPDVTNILENLKVSNNSGIANDVDEIFSQLGQRVKKTESVLDFCFMFNILQ